MRHLIVASHAHFSQGLLEAVEFVSGKLESTQVITAFVDGFDDISVLVDDCLRRIPEDEQVIVCTDVLGGSVNNEFLKRVASHENIHLITNMNLPLLLQLAFTTQRDTAAAVRSIVASDDVRPKYCNDLLQTEDEEEF